MTVVIYNVLHLLIHFHPFAFQALKIVNNDEKSMATC